MANKCWCESAKEEIEKAYKNPNPYHGALQDIMDAEIDYAKMCALCPCRKRRLERGEDPVEPEKKRKEVESEEQESDGPAADNKEAEEEDEDSKSEVSLVIAECDSDEEPDEEPRDVEEDEECETPPPPSAGSPPCSCDFPLHAIKQALEEWADNIQEEKNMSNAFRPLYDIARAKWMTHRYLHFILFSWNFPFVLTKYKHEKHNQPIYLF